MQYNNNSINSKRIKGNRYTQDMMIDPREFVMGAGECNWQEQQHMSPMQAGPTEQPMMPQFNPMHNPGGLNQQGSNRTCEPVTASDTTYSTCASVNCNESSQTCCVNSIVPPPITSANSKTRLIAGYQISDIIKFDRIATSPTPVLTPGPLTTTTVNVTGDMLQPGTYRFTVTEVCFGDLDLTITPDTVTLGGVELLEEDETEVFTTTYNTLIRTAVDTTASLRCCRRCLGTNIEYNNTGLSVTVAGAEGATTIPILLRGYCGCTNIEVETTITVAEDLTFTFDTLSGSLCRRPDSNPVLLDQYYQTRLTLGCINATITSDVTGTYTINILEAANANLVMRLAVSLLQFGTIAVLSTEESVQPRDIPVQTANFDFDSCLHV